MQSPTQNKEKKSSVINFFKDVDESEVNTKRDSHGRFAIHAAASWNHDLPEVKRLLSIGAEVDSKDKFNNTPLLEATQFNLCDSYFDIIKFLLESGAEVNVQDENGMTPLHFSVLSSNLKTVNLLIDFGADVNTRNNQGETPLSRAIFLESQNLEIFKLLLDRGSNVNNFGNQNMTPLHKACQWSKFELIKFLVKNGANVNLVNSRGRTPLMMLLEYYDLSSDWVKFLIKYSDVNTIDRFGDNVLCFYGHEDYKKVVWEIILEHIAKLQALDLPIHQKLHDTILNQPEYQEYFKQCTEELLLAKSTKIKNCWVTYFNLLLDRKRKLKNYAGNEDLVQAFENSDCLNKFPIYGADMMKKVGKGIETRKLFDNSTDELSYCLPIFNPTHLIIKDVLDCLTFKDYNRLIFKV